MRRIRKTDPRPPYQIPASYRHSFPFREAVPFRKPSRSEAPLRFAAHDSNPAHNKPSNARQLCELDALDYDAEKARTNPLPELLLPAGSPAALDAAIEAGADAVYFGASAFSARARAVNFSDGEIGPGGVPDARRTGSRRMPR